MEDAVDIISHMVELKQFQTTPESQKAMEDLTLAAGVKAALVCVKLDIEVSAQNGIVYVRRKFPETDDLAFMHDVERIARRIPGVKEVHF